MKLASNFVRYINFLRLAHKPIGNMVDIPRVSSLASMLAEYSADSLNKPDASTLDMGCGKTPRNPFGAARSFGIDIREDLEHGIKTADLAVDAIPFDDGVFDYITAYDFLEHIPRIVYAPERRFCFIELMNEVWRTLAPDGIFLSHTPIYPFSAVFQDPTHVNFLTVETFPQYFDDKNRLGVMYGFRGSFKVLKQALIGPHLVSILQKVELK